MIILGLTGGIATGKSTVAKLFEPFQVLFFNDDEMVKRLLENPTVQTLIVNQFENCASPEGGLDKNSLRNQVFKNPRELKRLENILHPLVEQERTKFIVTYQTKKINRTKVSFPLMIGVDTPLLFEKNVDQICDYTIVTICDRKKQIERALSRGTLTESQIKFIIKQQFSSSKKSKLADYIIDTGCSMEATQNQVKNIIEDITIKKMVASGSLNG